MKVALPMDISQSLESLKCDIPYFMMGQFSPFLQKLIDISLQIFEDEVQLIIFFYQFNQLYHIRMMQFAKNFYFIQVHTFVPVFILMFHSLDGNQLTCLFVEGFGHCPKTTVSQFIA